MNHHPISDLLFIAEIFFGALFVLFALGAALTQFDGDNDG